jgi:hypothetical protein
VLLPRREHFGGRIVIVMQKLCAQPKVAVVKR